MTQTEYSEKREFPRVIPSREREIELSPKAAQGLICTGKVVDAGMGGVSLAVPRAVTPQFFEGEKFTLPKLIYTIYSFHMWLRYKQIFYIPQSV